MKFSFLEFQKSSNFLLITEFFVYFSRFEYAMKRSGYGKIKGNPQYWDSDWDKLSGELLSNSIFTGVSQNLTLSEIRSCPPKKMIDKDTFETTPSSRNIIDSIKIVRNNLFHGGKFHGGPNEMESCRNINLVKDSLLLLHLVIEDISFQSQDLDSLRQHFNEFI